MPWHKESITEGEVDALREAARQAWADDTRYPFTLASDRSDRGQCYVTARWLVERLGGGIGSRLGHYVWLSPDEKFIIDLTCSHGSSRNPYKANGGFYFPVDVVDNPRTEKFIKRANRCFDNLPKLLKLGLGYGGDALPAEEPQADEDHQYWHDEPNNFGLDSREYRFVYANGQLEISPEHKHDELSQHAGIGEGHQGPVAAGYVVVNNQKATWEVSSNMNVKGLDRIFRDYTKHVGWEWGGLTNIDGEPISDDFAPKKGTTLNYAYANEHLYLGRTSTGALLLAADDDVDTVRTGVVRTIGRRAYVEPVIEPALPALYEWAEDTGFTLYAGNDNVIKTIEDLQEENLGANKEEFDKPRIDEREPSGTYKCPMCNQLFPTWNLYARHRKDHAQIDEPNQDGGFPEPDMDSTFPTHFTEQQPVVMPLAGYREAARVDGFEETDADEHWVAYHCGSPVAYVSLFEGRLASAGQVRQGMTDAILAKLQRYSDKQPKDLLDSPIPFIYDIDNDQISVGEPGTRTADIPGRFTPGGIVEGVYEPGGKVNVKTMTNMPYTVRHMIELWYYQHPELSVTGVQLQDDAGQTTKLAAEGDGVDVGNEIARLVAADPAVYEAAKALREAGGNVYAVGGAVRDVIRGQEPKDIDLMVQGLEPKVVGGTLQSLNGRVDVTGKDFGVFRYKDKGHEVEIALPRKERSTGDGHRDFDVQADPKMTPEEDMFRRDFTANAMAVNLATGELLDPYGGQKDILEGRLRAHNPDSLSEDPLRVVRALVANARHGLVPDDATRQQMAQNAGSLEALPQERVREELDKLFSADAPHKGIALAHETGVLNHIFPEVERAFGFDQNNPHHEHELGDHLLKVLERAAEKTQDPDVRLAALLHDIGKPDSAWPDPDTGSLHYYEKRLPDGTVLGADHETVGAEMARKALSRLRYPNARRDRIGELVQHHMWPAFTHEKGARKFLNRVGDHADDLLDLRWADQGGKAEYDNPAGRAMNLSLDTQAGLLERVRNEGQATNKSQLAINGNDLIQAGIPQGPQIGQILNKLTDAVVENPELNTREMLLTMAAQHGIL